jgi:hypothetical protein
VRHRRRVKWWFASDGTATVMVFGRLRATGTAWIIDLIRWTNFQRIAVPVALVHVLLINFEVWYFWVLLYIKVSDEDRIDMFP